jgi:DNA-3-methyladenine glycosylase II
MAKGDQMGRHMPDEYLSHLSKDRTLRKILRKVPPFRLRKKRNLFIRLISSIMSQQLSTKVAEIIFKRFLLLYDGEPTPVQILQTPDEQLRGIGLSNAKTAYVKNVAAFTIEKGMDAKVLSKMSNEEVIAYLTEIKGVGRWTVEMLLIFSLGREDVFAPDDLGIQTAMIGLYKLPTKDKKILLRRMLEISAAWSPYRSYACLHLWNWKDGQ